MKYISSDDLKVILTALLAKVQTNIGTAVAGANGLTIQIVPTKPTADISTSTLYLVEKPVGEQTSENKYDEYMYVNGAWETYGTVELDLSAYAKTADVITAINAALANYSTTANMTTAITTALADYAKTVDVTTAINAAVADKVTAAQVATQISTSLQNLTAEEITALKTELGI